MRVDRSELRRLRRASIVSSALCVLLSGLGSTAIPLCWNAFSKSLGLFVQTVRLSFSRQFENLHVAQLPQFGGDFASHCGFFPFPDLGRNWAEHFELFRIELLIHDQLEKFLLFPRKQRVKIIGRLSEKLCSSYVLFEGI